MSDNLEVVSKTLNEWLGVGKESVVPTDEQYPNASLVEKVNYLQQEIKSMKEDGIASSGGKTCSLFVYLPSTDALADYTDSEVVLYSPSGNQNAKGKLKRSGGAYSTVLYFDFTGDCNLQWTAVNKQGSSFILNETLSIEKASQEFRLGSSTHRLNIKTPKSTALASYTGKSISLVYPGKTLSTVFGEESDCYSTVIYSDYDGDGNLKYNYLTGSSTIAMAEPVRLNTEIIDLEVGIESLDPGLLSWSTIRNICASGRAQLFFKPGDVLYGGGTDKWHVVAVESNAIKVWSKAIGRAYGYTYWELALAKSHDMWRAWNENHADFGMTAISSEMMTYQEALTIADAADRKSNPAIEYWLDTTHVDNHVHMVSNTGTINSVGITAGASCFPALWFGELPEHKPSALDYTFDEIATLCELGLADNYDLCEVGTELRDGWYVIEHKKNGTKDQLRLWKKQNLGSSVWGTTNTKASSYYSVFNSTYNVDCAFSSGLLTKDDVTTTWFTSNRSTGSNYWLATTGTSSGEYYRVLYNGDVVSTSSGNSSGCSPFVWIQ